MIEKPTGQTRVDHNLRKTLFYIEKLKNLINKKPSSLTQTKIDSLKKKIFSKKKKLVFLSTRAKDKVNKILRTKRTKRNITKTKELITAKKELGSYHL